MVFSIDKNLNKIIATIQVGGRTEKYECIISACDNPVCTCTNIYLELIPIRDRSGSKTDGYCSPEEMAVEMFEEALEPFLQEMNRLSDLKMLEEAKFYCMRIIKGIYEYEKDSRSEFKDWATDMSAESFGYILGQWIKKSTTEDKQEMNEFIGNECPDWAKWAIYKD